MAKEIIDLWKDWSKLWQEVEPPGRPSEKELIFWNEKLENFGSAVPQVLILGSTPEFRDFFASKNIPITLLEANEVMYREMSKLRKKPGGQETLVLGNWLEAASLLDTHRFDFVLGDIPHCNLRFADWPKFFENVHGVLKPGGFFLVSTILYDYPERQSIEEMFQKYEQTPERFHDFKNRIWEIYQLLDEPGVYDRERRTFNMYVLRDRIREAAKGRFPEEEVDKNLWYIPGDLQGERFGEVVEVGPDLAEQITLQSRWFVLESLYQVPDHPVFKIRRAMILISRKI